MQLSQANNTLYSFAFPDEQDAAETEVGYHAIIKADVRSSTEIVHQMKQKGLNPASYFSLNFFNPINELLSAFDAEKVFIEGDAVILSITEKAQAAARLYGVARACGLAIRMLSIVKRYNQATRKHRLPVLELGIGICYMDDAPTFLFDGKDRIMISPAIHFADRMASCAKALRNAPDLTPKPFNLYVFQTIGDKEVQGSRDDLYLRYNINGIELNETGFKKLQKEINLQQREIETPGTKRTTTIHTGVYPTGSGSYQRLIIREAPIRRLDLASMAIIGTSAKSYYEICTSKKVYDRVRRHSSGGRE
jgi:hypothetical protein